MQQRPIRSHESSSEPGAPGSRRLSALGAILAIAMLVLAFAGCVPVSRPAVTAQTQTAQSAATSISASELEGKYGARVNLVAVTAVGGLVDFRMKILDAEKAKQLFLGKAPSLRAERTGAVLTAPEDSGSQVEQLQDNGMVFILYPNINNAVKRGDKVTVIFGDVRLEPVSAQ